MHTHNLNTDLHNNSNKFKLGYGSQDTTWLLVVGNTDIGNANMLRATY
jgi:hypothetical protein